jgi:alpha-galactosidase
MNRREFNLLASTALLAPHSLAAPAAAVRFEYLKKTWILSNDFYERELVFDESRGLITRRFVDRHTGRDWTANQTHWGSEIFLIIDDEVFYGASPANRFRYVDHQISDNLLRIRLQLSPQQLNASLCYRMFEDSPIIEQWCELENTSGRPIGSIERFDPFLLTLKPGPYYLNWVHGIRDYGHQRGVGENLQPYAPYRVRREPLTSEITLISSSPGERFGRKNLSTTEQLSWFALEDPNAKCGLMGGLEWSGAWVLHFAQTPQATVVYGGVDRFAHVLQPGTRLESPRVFYGPYSGDVDSGLRGLHTYLKRHLATSVDPQFPWVTYNTWFAYYWKYNEGILKREVEVARDLGVECFCVDAGWSQGPFELSGDEVGIDPGLGHWVASRDKFPNGLGAFADFVRQNGMKFGLWLEPERAHAKFVGKEIKETWLSKRDGYYVGLNETHILCLGNPEVVEWMKSWIAPLIRETKLEWIRWDANVYNMCNRPNHGHQVGDGDYRHIRGLYEIFGWLNREFPQVRIENCAGGGNRNDYGTMRYAATNWNSDGSWPSYRVRYQVFGSSYAYPARYQNTEYVYQGGTTGHSHSYGRQEKTDSDSPADYLDYLFRSRMFGGFGISDRTAEWPENIRAAAKRAIAAYKKARPALQGDVYHLLPQPLILTPPLSEPSQWEAIEYHQPERDEAVVFCFRAQSPENEIALRIRGLEPKRAYRVTFETSGQTVEIRGAGSVTVRLRERNRSEVLWVRRA